MGFLQRIRLGCSLSTSFALDNYNLLEDPSPRLYWGRSEGRSTTDEVMSLHSSRSPSPDYTVGIRGRSTRGGPFHPGSSRRPSPFPGDPRVDHHRPLDAAHQVWQGPFRAVRTINKVSVSQYGVNKIVEPRWTLLLHVVQFPTIGTWNMDTTPPLLIHFNYIELYIRNR